MIDTILFLMLLVNLGCVTCILDAQIQYHLNKRHLLSLMLDSELCMCGEYISAHHWAFSNHAPVSETEYMRRLAGELTVDFPYRWKGL